MSEAVGNDLRVCGHCGHVLVTTLTAWPRINRQPFCSRACYEAALYARGLTMRRPVGMFEQEELR